MLTPFLCGACGLILIIFSIWIKVGIQNSDCLDCYTLIMSFQLSFYAIMICYLKEQMYQVRTRRYFWVSKPLDHIFGRNMKNSVGSAEEQILGRASAGEMLRFRMWNLKKLSAPPLKIVLVSSLNIFENSDMGTYFYWNWWKSLLRKQITSVLESSRHS